MAPERAGQTRNKGPYIDGEWHDGEETLTVTDLTDGSVFAEVSAAGPAEARAALAAAAGCQPRLRTSTVPERCDWLTAIADGIEARREDLVEAIVREAGKPVSSARSEVDSAAERFRRAVEEARSIRGEHRRGTTASHEGWEAVVTPEAIGTVLCITPYNYPLATTALQVAPALAAGNGVVLKPSSNTPVTAAILADVVADTDVPDGALNYVPGRGSAIGETLASDDRVDAIAMTGSTGAGKRVARQSGLVNLHMELGGNAPVLVFPDADLDAAASAITSGALSYAGQRCSAVSRVLAHESIHDDLVARIDHEMADWELGDLFDADTDIGPLIDEGQAEWVEGLVSDARDAGAKLVRGGDREGNWFEPTLLADVPRDARIVHDEQFGPVCPVTTFADREDALALVDEGDLALDGAVFTADYDRAMDVARRIDAGAVRINGAPSHGLGDIPFGGNGDSGIGREGLHTSIEDYLRTKSIVL
ncbi:MAG: aldehyde dehydrogenase [Halobacteriaceae archaeon]